MIIHPTPKTLLQHGTSWSDMSQREIIQKGSLEEWDNKELKVIAGSLQSISKHLDKNGSLVNHIYAQQLEIDQLKKQLLKLQKPGILTKIKNMFK